jgi:outer membrane lipoprotein-sorting protein
MKYLHILICCFSLATVQKTGAQNVTNEFLLLQKRYANLDNYSVSMNYKAYKGHTSSEVADVQAGKFEIFRQKMKFVMGDIEVLRNGNYTVQIDKQFQEMDISRTPTGWTPPVFGNFSRMDSILKKHNAVSFREESDGIRLLVFNLKNSGEEYEKIEIRYLPSGHITSITLFYRGVSDAYGVQGDYKPRVEIQYKEQNFSPGLTDEYFSEKKYFLVQDGKTIPNSTFKNYKIFDQL